MCGRWASSSGDRRAGSDCPERRVLAAITEHGIRAVMRRGGSLPDRITERRYQAPATARQTWRAVRLASRWMSRRVSPSSGGFRLTPSEDFLFGVRMKGDSIRFGPPGGKLLWAGVILPVALAIGAATLWAGRGALAMVVAVWIAVGGTAYLVAAARSGVSASPDGVTVRSALRSQHYPWRQISDITIVEGKPTPQFGLWIGEHGGGIRPDVDSCKAYLVLVDRSLVRLAGFESAIRTSGLSGGTASPTEIKVAALDRYRRVFAPPRPIPS